MNLTRVACISAGHLSFNAELPHMEGGPCTRASGTQPSGCESLEVLVAGGGEHWASRIEMSATKNVLF